VIKNAHLLKRFEDAESRASPVDFPGNLRLLEAMHEHARRLGVFEQGPDAPVVNVRLARALNV